MANQNENILEVLDALGKALADNKMTIALKDFEIENLKERLAEAEKEAQHGNIV